MKLNPETCQAVVTITDADGPLGYQCPLPQGHEGPHETLYKEARSGGLKFDLSWLDLVPQVIAAPYRSKARPHVKKV